MIHWLTDSLTWIIPFHVITYRSYDVFPCAHVRFQGIMWHKVIPIEMHGRSLRRHNSKRVCVCVVKRDWQLFMASLSRLPLSGTIRKLSGEERRREPRGRQITLLTPCITISANGALQGNYHQYDISRCSLNESKGKLLIPLSIWITRRSNEELKGRRRWSDTFRAGDPGPRKHNWINSVQDDSLDLNNSY